MIKSLSSASESHYVNGQRGNDNQKIFQLKSNMIKEEEEHAGAASLPYGQNAPQQQR